MNRHESPVAARKTGKSRSHEKKKNDGLASTKMYTHHDEEKRPIVIPKSSKGVPLPQRAKSPGMR